MQGFSPINAEMSSLNRIFIGVSSMIRNIVPFAMIRNVVPFAMTRNGIRWGGLFKASLS